MALGYCKTCDKLVPILPGPQKWGTRERTWYPVQHERPEGGDCPGRKREL